MRNIEALTKKVNSIPHLEIPFDYDAARIEKEIREMPQELIHYEATMQENHSHGKTKWSNLSLYSYDGSYICDRMEGAGPGELERILGKFKRTKLAEWLPYTYEVIDSLGAGSALARIEQIDPMATMGWHNHVFELYHPETLMIIQIPIVMPEKFKYSVMSNKEYMTTDFGKNQPKVFEKRYEPGTPVIFNAYHYHNVFNYDTDSCRLTIRFFADLRDDKVYDIVENAVNQYTGEYIEE